MAAKIGILGESTVIAVSTLTTVYTVPTDKATRIRVLYMSEGSAQTNAYSILVGSPGDEITIKVSTLGNHDQFTGSMPLTTPDPALSIRSDFHGIMQGSALIDMTNLAFAGETVCSPLAVDYFLSTGDTVKFNISSSAGSPTDHLIQVHGVEDDA